jgi:hypothetical protein
MSESSLDVNVTELVCVACKYSTCKKNDYAKHLATQKHTRAIDSMSIGETILNQYICGCGKSYKHQSTLCTHKKKCTFKTSSTTSTAKPMQPDAIAEIINQNREFKELIIEQHKQLMQQSQTFIEYASNNCSSIVQNTNIQNVNVNNTFNLQLFLNIDCKDALSMEDFLKTVVVQLKDLEHAQITGYSDGVSNIIVKALKALEINKRPIHCSDLKRKTMYIKEGGEWSKESEDNARVKDMIRDVECKSIKKIPDWVKEHPHCINGTHKDSTPYLKMVQQVSGGDLQKGEENINKIINTIAKEVVITK